MYILVKIWASEWVKIVYDQTQPATGGAPHGHTWNYISKMLVYSKYGSQYNNNNIIVWQMKRDKYSHKHVM